MLRRAVVPFHGLVPEQRAQFEDERIDSNRRRVLVIVPPLMLVQITMMALYNEPIEGPGDSFRQGIWWVHSTTLPMFLTVWGAALFSTIKNRKIPLLGDIVAMLSIALGMCLSVTTHRWFATNSSYTIALFSSALILRPTLVGAILGFLGSNVAFVALLPYVQRDADIRIAFVSTATTAVLVSLVFSRILHASAVREFIQRLTIEQQRDELRAWNADLEKRVERQVQEALMREREARALDAQLRMKVRARSQELVQAILEGTPEDEALVAGSRFEQHFEIERVLGSGAMGDVYAARDLETGQEVAIKLMRRWDGMSPSDVGRFAMEAAATASIVHPAIVRTYHVDVTAAGRLYLVMELVAGQTLADALMRGRFDAAQTARFGAVAAEALAMAHRAGVVHRDIKPGNMMLTNLPPGLRILDFGVSKLAVPGNAYKTVAGQIMGTPQYMAPEQILGTSEATGACDVYSLGLVLHEMLRGEPTFAAKNIGDLMRAQMTATPPSVRAQLGAEIPEELEQLIAQCLEKEPVARPTADELTAALLGLADILQAPPLEKCGVPRYLRGSIKATDGHAATIPAASI
ncbi:MAG TPA: serine/threonine-protein kinase [Polyangium sp.]|nr:serine/threonine-protein kinase [Polyangium sp.]